MKNNLLFFLTIVLMVGFIFTSCEEVLPVELEYEIVLDMNVPNTKVDLFVGQFVTITPTLYPGDALIQTLLWELYDTSSQVLSIGRSPTFIPGMSMMTGNSVTITGLNEGETDVMVTAIGSRGNTINAVITISVEGINTRFAALPDKVAALDPSDDAKFTIEVYAPHGVESLEPQVLYFGGREVELTLSAGAPGAALSLGADLGHMFTVGDGVTLIMEGVALYGVSHNFEGSLVVVESGGTFEMGAGSMISGNNNRLSRVEDSVAILAVGGAVFVENGGTFILDGGTISGNEAFQGGGVGVVAGGLFIMESGEITSNIARLEGGGVRLQGNEILPAVFTMRGGEISSNYAGWRNSAGNGGGVHAVTFATFNFYGGLIYDNRAFSGGGVYLAGNSARLNMHDGAAIILNTAFGDATGHGGGGVFLFAGFDGPTNYIAFTMYGGLISGNTTANNGGGVRASHTNRFTMHNGSITGNTAREGGGVFFTAGSAEDRPSYFTMLDGYISGNVAETFGGGIRISSGNHTLRMVNGTIHGGEVAIALRNWAETHNALSIAGAARAQHGTFTGDTWDSQGYLTFSDVTIEVADGVLIRP